jgi:hypothetical protein
MDFMIHLIVILSCQLVEGDAGSSNWLDFRLPFAFSLGYPQEQGCVPRWVRFAIPLVMRKRTLEALLMAENLALRSAIIANLAQQRRFNVFREELRQQRPHQALGGLCSLK